MLKVNIKRQDLTFSGCFLLKQFIFNWIPALFMTNSVLAF